jgi:molecular chaperone DnaK (HSP70)
MGIQEKRRKQDLMGQLYKETPQGFVIDPEKAKINLSSDDIPELSQKKYFSILEDNYLEKINKLFDNILKDGNMNKKDVNQVILIGGSTKNPFIRKTISNYFQKDLNHIIDPDTAVSFGATIYGNSLLSKNNTVFIEFI